MKINENIKVAMMCTVMPIALSVLLVQRFKMSDIASTQMLYFFTVAVSSLIFPKLGNFIYKIGSKAGKILGNYIARVILFFVYVFAVLPTGILMKMVKRDRLRLKKQNINSYWVDCEQVNTDYEYQF